jgi:SAM-dependent methyltransferase
MTTHDEWIDLLAPMDRWNERIVMASFALLGMPRSYLDIGSGTGAMVNLARRLGVDAWGVDQLDRTEYWLLARDLRAPLDQARNYELVTCIEVAEHIPVEHDATLCDSIARHVAPGGTLVFTAAHPGQGGEEHVNLRPAAYWRTMLHGRGLSFSDALSWQVAHIWQCTRTPQVWLVDNVQVFKRGDGE